MGKGSVGYDPNLDPDSEEWLGLDESERLQLVMSYHERRDIELPNARLHALIHVVIENQLASGEGVVVDAFQRLQREGLDRHETVHAVGSVLAGHLHGILSGEGPRGTDESNRKYLEAVRGLTADGWRESWEVGEGE